MRRLVPLQAVTITLDTEDEGIDCLVRSVSGPVALLHRKGEIPAEVTRKLAAGSSCLMAFTHAGALVGLRGIATTASEDLTELAFVVSDGVQVEERRVAERVSLITRIRIGAVTEEGSAEPAAETFTADVSLGGVRVERRPGLGAGPAFRLELFLRDEPSPIACGAQLARETPTHLGLKFTGMHPEQRSRLARVLAEHQLRTRSSA